MHYAAEVQTNTGCSAELNPRLHEFFETCKFPCDRVWANGQVWENVVALLACASFLIVTEAPGMTDPLASRADPDTCPVSNAWLYA